MSKYVTALFKFGFLLYAFTFFLFGCVPSPTATPPRQTPFPTLPFVEGTPTLEFLATDVFGTPAATSSIPTLAPTALPLPTNSSARVDNFPPLVQLTVQDPELPISLEQPVALNVLAADNNLIARLDVYDNNVLLARAPVVAVSPVYSNQFIWKPTKVGKHTLRAVAYDANGNASQPAQLELNVITNNRAPNVQITAPQGIKDAEIGAPILIQGVATDDVAVTRMELLVDNELVTFVVPERAGGVTPFAVAIPWTPNSTGAHNIVLRAYDNQNESDDSLRYSIRVFDNQAPVVTAHSEFTTLALGDVLVVNALALAGHGIARVELIVDNQLADARNSAAPSQQTALQALLTAPDLAEGTHSFSVRALDFTGQTAETPRVTIQVVRAELLRSSETRVAQNTATPLPPTPTATPQIVLPGPPTLDLQLTNAPVILPNAAQIQIIARGASELERLQLWARMPGETSAELMLEENLKGATEKTLNYSWNVPRAGVVELYARVSDNLGQARSSTPLRFSVQPPPVATPAPAIFNFAQTWYAESPAARFDVTFTQIGRALRGTFLEAHTDGKIFGGNVVSGAVNENNVLFAVEFSKDENAPPHTLDFDCSFNARPPVLTCNYVNEKGERGSAVFQPLAP